MNGGEDYAHEWHHQQNNIEQAERRFAGVAIKAVHAQGDRLEQKGVEQYEAIADNIIQNIFRNPDHASISLRFLFIMVATARPNFDSPVSSFNESIVSLNNIFPSSR